MPRHPRQLSDSGIYHVMMRGINRDTIFLDDEDCARFLRSLGEARDASGCRVLAYCLMSNHAHLVLRTGDEPIGAVIKRLGVRYAGWFNRKYGRVGHLFQDRFKSIPVEDDAYFVTLLRYVWNNPVEAGLVDRPALYVWSSCHLLGRESLLVDAEELRRLLPSDPLDWVASSPQRPDRPPGKRVRQPGHTDEQVRELLFRACGAANEEAFFQLDSETQVRAIRELRTRSVAYAQIATATGLSASSVRRLHTMASSPLAASSASGVTRSAALPPS